MSNTTFAPTELFAHRIDGIPTSFIREILKVTVRPEIISFAGGLPNPKFFPVDEVREATNKVLNEDGRTVLQYSTTEGYLPLREWIAARYKEKQGLTIHPDEILITSGSQQAIDLLGKVLLDKGDRVIIEKPGYLGAIQSLSVFEPEFLGVTLNDDGVNTDELAQIFESAGAKVGAKVKMFSSIPNFQNPSGISYSAAVRERVADVVERYNTVVVEDDPYGELRFKGTRLPSLKHYLGDQVVLLGSFSKIVAPGMRIGWLVAPKPLMEKLVIVKQASDLHTNYFAQRVIYRYVTDNVVDTHIQKISAVYGAQAEIMLAAIREYFPQEVRTTQPEGGMFLWATLPDGLSSITVFDKTIAQNVAFVPGKPFYVGSGGENTMRLNYSNADADTIREGIRRMGLVLESMYALQD